MFSRFQTFDVHSVEQSFRWFLQQPSKQMKILTTYLQNKKTLNVGNSYGNDV
jgi:hypothetical protein